MGSRLKGKKRKDTTGSYRIYKLVAYGLLAAAVIAGLWYLYLSKDNFLDGHGNPQTEHQAGGPPP